MGQSVISFKGERWRGRTTLSTNDRGDRRLVRIQNGYVSSDGHEIRSFPGWRTLVDLSSENNAEGYNRYINDAWLPYWTPIDATAIDQVFRSETDELTYYRLSCRAKPIHYHFFEQVDDRLIICGESRFREVPLAKYFSSPAEYGDWQSISSCGIIINGTDTYLVLTMADTVGSYNVGFSPVYYHGILAGEPVYVEGMTVTGTGSISLTEASVLQALLDANVNGRVHKVSNITGVNIRLSVDIQYPVVAQDEFTVTAGTVHKVRANYDNYYGETPAGITPYHGTTEYSRIDDPDAITSWRINPEIPLAVGNSCSHKCYPAYLANRQRDFDDNRLNFIEGIQPSAYNGTQIGLSRREQKPIPYRLVPEVAGNRIIMAAPGYGCLFQIPLMVPIDSSNWPLTPLYENLGKPALENDLYDKPRCLGIPKCRLIECSNTPAPTSPGDDLDLGFDINIACVSTGAWSPTDPGVSWPAGTYNVCATYYDAATGEEGPPSETIVLTIPAISNVREIYTIRLHYFHPGYVMPECLAQHIRVYVSDTDGEPMGLYATLSLGAAIGDRWHGQNEGDPWDSAKYGFNAGGSPGYVSTPNDDFLSVEWRPIYVFAPTIAPSNPGGSLSERIDFFKPPMQSASMPRGASSARYIRGTLVSVGHAGVDSETKRLVPVYGSLLMTGPGSLNTDEKVVTNRVHESSRLLPADGTQLTGPITASRYFPDAYQGIEVVNDDLFWANFQQTWQLNKVRNMMTAQITDDSASHQRLHYELLEFTERVGDRWLRYNSGTGSELADELEYQRTNKRYFWKQFKGQVQVADPGAPWRVSKTGGRGIQFLDPNKDDDGVAVFQFAGNALICTRKETYFYAWQRSAHAEAPQLLNSDFGCIAPNSGVEFDGGTVWISERGPVAMGQGVQFVGGDLEGDFVGESRRYLTDSEGMMRHSWGCHDGARGLVYFGLITTDATHTVNYQMGTVAVTSASDQQLSRAACNEVLIWSYRTGAFSYWNPPSGLEVLWMRQLRVATDTAGKSYENRICFLAADGRIYALDDQWQDTNADAVETTAAANGTASTALVVAATPTWGTDASGGAAARESGVEGGTLLIRSGMVVQAFNSDNEIVWQTTVSSANPATSTITLAAAQTWTRGQAIRIGVRPSMVIETSFIGGEAVHNMESKAVQVRYTLHGSGKANANVQVLKSDLDTGDAPLVVQFCPSDRLVSLGSTITGDRHARRRQIEGDVTAPEIAVKLTVISEPQVRITDIALEV